MHNDDGLSIYDGRWRCIAELNLPIYARTDFATYIKIDNRRSRMSGNTAKHYQCSGCCKLIFQDISFINYCDYGSEGIRKLQSTSAVSAN